ncbi:hypothetical protein M5K25_011971 [Dendrobium thyrsiflorum]|uniref:Uncharacterized protein n=1 Tax=Dendrobium thyrsiflorum TaxID=117978 RepID=A0ABD0V446_DENTH
MVDPEQDHGFVYDYQGRVYVLRSPFFNINFEIDHTVQDYHDRIFFSLTTAIDKHQIPNQWQVLQRPPTLPLRINSHWAVLDPQVVAVGKPVVPRRDRTPGYRYALEEEEKVKQERQKEKYK